ncbi:hypothetical protein HHK36_002577 [Tetracentron sinense]|uniref:Uncharacterized protein n=1 Tax=Tetracentron sinense TaxID=13715 RepID=A0A834ZQK7_TETSI|nr:hypothetical protein HHK36_002577 [Tetracentron sinense]
MKDDKFLAAVGDETMSGMVKEEYVYRVADVEDWEDGERMVERITSSASSDSYRLNISFETGSRPHSSRDGTSAILDRGKPTNSWRRDVFENGNSSTFLLDDPDDGYLSLRQNTFGAGREFPMKEFYGGPGAMSAGTSFKGGIPEPNLDDFPHLRGQRWNLAGDRDHYSRKDIGIKFHENPTNKFGNIGWSRSGGSTHALYPERLYQNSEAAGFSSFGSLSHSMGQLHVLPPPSLASMHKSSYRGQTAHPGGSLAFLDSEMWKHHVPIKIESTTQTGYDSGYQEKFDQCGMMDTQQENSNPEEQKLEKTTMPRSEEDEIPFSDNEHAVSAIEACKANMMAASSSVSPVNDEEWAIENKEELQVLSPLSMMTNGPLRTRKSCMSKKNTMKRI